MFCHATCDMCTYRNAPAGEVKVEFQKKSRVVVMRASRNFVSFEDLVGLGAHLVRQGEQLVLLVPMTTFPQGLVLSRK